MTWWNDEMEKMDKLAAAMQCRTNMPAPPNGPPPAPAPIPAPAAAAAAADGFAELATLMRQLIGKTLIFN